MHLPRTLSALLALGSRNQRREASPAPLRLDFDIHAPFIPALEKRATEPISLFLNNKIVRYVADVSIGTPAQSLTLSISMTSADTWITASNSSFCAAGNCKTYGSYDARASTSYRYIAGNFTKSLSEGKLSGSWISDTITLGKSGIKINGQQLGLALNNTATVTGQIGLSYPEGTSWGNNTYPIITQQLVDQGRIKSQAYSLYLNSQQSSSGSILFGGVDTAKFSGKLTKLNVVSAGANTKRPYPAISLSAMSFGSTQIFADSDYRVIVSPENTLSRLPAALVTKIGTALNGTWDSVEELYFVPCSQRAESRTLDFTFSSVTIAVAMSEFIRTYNGTCYLGVSMSENGGTNVVGLTFLRSAYVVFDLTHNSISLAQSRFDTNTTQIMEIDGSANDPALTAVAYSSSAPNPTASTPATTSVPASATSSSTNVSPGLSSGAIAGIAIGGVGGIALIALGAFFLWRRRRNQKKQQEHQQQSGLPEMVADPRQAGDGYAASPYTGHMSYPYDDKKSPDPSAVLPSPASDNFQHPNPLGIQHQQSFPADNLASSGYNDPALAPISGQPPGVTATAAPPAVELPGPYMPHELPASHAWRTPS